ncbi:hypothetical protein AKJ64_04100, partial [candidate division MSBL1 archaeon SCGC-AAA259E17]
EPGPVPASLAEKDPGDDEKLTHRSMLPVEGRIGTNAEVPPAVIALEHRDFGHSLTLAEPVPHDVFGTGT